MTSCLLNQALASTSAGILMCATLLCLTETWPWQLQTEIQAVMLHRIIKWRFIWSKVSLIEFVKTDFADLTDCSAIFYCHSACRELSEKNISLLQHLVYLLGSSLENWFTVANKCDVKHCSCFWWLLAALYFMFVMILLYIYFEMCDLIWSHSTSFALIKINSWGAH